VASPGPAGDFFFRVHLNPGSENLEEKAKTIFEATKEAAGNSSIYKHCQVVEYPGLVARTQVGRITETWDWDDDNSFSFNFAQLMDQEILEPTFSRAKNTRQHEEIHAALSVLSAEFIMSTNHTAKGTV